MKLGKEERYIRRRLRLARRQAREFLRCRRFPVNPRKIVFTCIEGTTGYSCNPKYIAEELLRRGDGYELVWLVDDMGKEFPPGIRKVKNTLRNRAYELSTAKFWIDNSRKQLECRKRRGQVYIQTWHAKLGFKPTCLDRGASFSRIAYLVSKHDSGMIDYVLSNSDWYDRTLPTGMLYTGEILRTGSPRCDILVNGREEARDAVRQKHHLSQDTKILMYAPTFRGGSQGTNRTVEKGDHAPDYGALLDAFGQRFGGEWIVFLRLHPQLTARHIASGARDDRLIDVSREDDMYELLAGCDAFLTDYSSAAFDAAVMRLPIFLYADDYMEYEQERGKLLWDLRKLPFPLAENDRELADAIRQFDQAAYEKSLEELFQATGMTEDGNAAKRVCDAIKEMSDESKVCAGNPGIS